MTHGPASSGVQFQRLRIAFQEPVRREYSSRFRLVKNQSQRSGQRAGEADRLLRGRRARRSRSDPRSLRGFLVEPGLRGRRFPQRVSGQVLPADADPMDLRYNMILWTHSPGRSWSSGASLRDPRTGEIITGRVYLGSDRIRQDFLILSGLKAPYAGKEADTQGTRKIALARIRQLSAHEVGHTLGFGHNYVSSIANRASVMDYPASLYQDPRERHPRFLRGLHRRASANGTRCLWRMPTRSSRMARTKTRRSTRS